MYMLDLVRSYVETFSVDAKNWSNILVLVELLFCIPVVNVRLFSLEDHQIDGLPLVKRDLIISFRIKVDAPPLAQWDSSAAVDLRIRHEE